MQLTEWTMHHNLTGSNSNVVRAADVQVELLMPHDYPERGPVLRVIAPRFHDVNNLNLSLSQSMERQPASDRTGLTVSRDLENHNGEREGICVCVCVCCSVVCFLGFRLSLYILEHFI